MSIVGIDLGTTHSLIAVWQNGKTVVIPNALGEKLTPSVVGIDDNGDLVVGRVAQERLFTHPQHTFELFKRYMGSQREICLGSQQFLPHELASFVLRALKEDAENYTGHSISEAVISVPAYFSEHQRRMTRLAGEMAGLKVRRLVNEPTAAALAYGIQEKNEQRAIVLDLGGGTFDVSLLELFDGVIEVNASAGDNHLGGEDFLEQLVRYCCAKQAVILESLTQTERTTLRQAVKRVLHDLSIKQQASLKVALASTSIDTEIERSEFEQVAANLLDRLRKPIERVLTDSELQPSDIDQLILVGGATRMPMVKTMATKLFSRFPVTGIDPDQVVAIGAAIQGGLLMQDKAFEEVVMTDVCPYSLGVEVAASRGKYTETGLYQPILERNCVVPISRVERFYTTADHQSKVSIQIYQGESRRVKNNIKLGDISVDIPIAQAGQEAVDVRFTYDVNGLLEVEITVVSTTKTFRTIIEKNPGQLSPEEITKRFHALSRLKIHPREHLPNRFLLARGERLFEQALGEKRTLIGQLIFDFENALARQDQHYIAEAYHEVSAMLDHLEAEM
ncbi:Hsp70 family protein [Zooshikella ganghwensis]|uniref:Molecular chaperone HscC n=1 Tax=Zooshikella ganghwensis TaxID=202772 RepID=A0A4P9VQE9_9GAMM|nr:molecular chaperone HscC [Zooshikella ganghwensis]RDH45765.1 molecular chaperone HscC [Zooshikella ganghwensis]